MRIEVLGQTEIAGKPLYVYRHKGQEVFSRHDVMQWAITNHTVDVGMISIIDIIPENDMVLVPAMKSSTGFVWFLSEETLNKALATQGLSLSEDWKNHISPITMLL